MGRRLQRRRELQGLSAPDLAAKAGVSKMTVRNAERGLSEPTPTTIALIAEALGAEPHEVWGPSVRGSAVEIRRRKLGLSQGGAARLSGVSRKAIAHAERGGRIRPRLAQKLALALSLPIDQVLPELPEEL